MMFGARVRFGITYKAGQPGFQIYTRKYFHNFKVSITTKNFDGAVGDNIRTMNAYVMADKQSLNIYDALDHHGL